MKLLALYKLLRALEGRPTNVGTIPPRDSFYSPHVCSVCYFYAACHLPYIPSSASSVPSASPSPPPPHHPAYCPHYNSQHNSHQLGARDATSSSPPSLTPSLVRSLHSTPLTPARHGLFHEGHFRHLFFFKDVSLLPRPILCYCSFWLNCFFTFFDWKTHLTFCNPCL